MKKLISVLLVILCFSACADDSDDQEVQQQTNHIVGTAHFAGIELRFIFDLNKIQLINHNNTVIRCTVKDLTNNSILVGDIITWPGSTDNKENLVFANGDQVEISVWQGPASVFWGNILGLSADYIGQATLQEGNITVTYSGADIGWLVNLPATNGGQCTLAGQYSTADIYDQVGNNLYCDNISSDWLDIKLYVLRPVVGGYEADFEIASMLVLFEDVTQITYEYDVPDDIALKITTISKTEIYGCILNIANQTCAEITDPITLP